MEKVPKCCVALVPMPATSWLDPSLQPCTGAGPALVAPRVHEGKCGSSSWHLRVRFLEAWFM